MSPLFTSSSSFFPSRPIITSGNVLLVQFVSDLSVTSDGFIAHYTSVTPGTQVSRADAGAGTRAIPPKPAGKPTPPELPATTAKPPATTVKYVPTERPRPVKPNRGRGQGSTGQDRRVPVNGSNGRRPGRWRYVHAKACVWTCSRCDLHLWCAFLCILSIFSPSKSPLCQSL